MSVETTIARVAASHVTSLMDVEEPHNLRIRGLYPKEITELVGILGDWQPKQSSQSPRLVVTVDTPWPGLPPSCLLQSGETATQLRNGTCPVVFIEHADYSDAQGLKNVRSITDRELLASADRRVQLVRAARGDTSTTLEDALETVYSAMCTAGNKATPSVRMWAGFVAGVAVELDAKEVVDGSSAWTAIGSSLHHLDLFPDTRIAGATDTERVRLLRRNIDQRNRLFTNSRESDLEDLYEKVQGVEFRELDETPTEPAKADVLRVGFSGLLRADESPKLDRLELRYWEQVESKRSERKGLGQRIRESLQASETPERADELPAELVEALDNRENEAALDFLDLDPPEPDLPRLSTIVDPKLRGALEKLADPPQSATKTPLRKLLSELHALLREEGELESLVLERRQRKGANDELSAALFAWVYGPTLAEIGEGGRLQTDPSLTDTRPLLDFIDRADSSSDSEGELPEWADLRLQVRPADKKGALFSFEWRPRTVPGLVAFARATARPDEVCWRGPEDTSFDDWIRASMEEAPLRDAVAVEAPAELESWARVRQDHLRSLRDGLRASAMADFATAYTSLLERIRADHVPQGERQDVVAALIGQDCFTSDLGEVVMLPTHPIRQRWIGAHFQEMSTLLTQCLDSELALNPINDGALFFEHVSVVSPHAQPSVLVIGDEQRIAVREQDWSEHFEILQDQRASRSEWLSGLDDGAVDEIASVIVQYVAAYPHKSDGLHLLMMVRPRGSRSLERLVDQVSRKLKREVGERPAIRLSILVDHDEIRDVERVLQRFDSADHRAVSDFPAIHVSLHVWDKGGPPSLAEISTDVDIAIVPNLFGAETITRESTADARSFKAAFRPWLDEPTRIEPADTSGKQSTSVSRILLPAGQDAMLEAWSTINTRHFRRRPVGSDPTPSDVDYFEQQVPFGESAEFFDELHSRAHWVVTVDAFVGREQVDALKNAPEVILVKTGVGSSDGYRMVVSSKAGKDFVVARLRRRLAEQLPGDVDIDHKALAEELYDRARLLVPGIVLRSLGLGRTAAEMVGLVCARERVTETKPIELDGDGFEAWISLDEHAGWLGGVRRSRADMARIVGRWKRDHLEVEVLVVEAKMRKSVDVSRADEQLSRSVEMLQAALASDEEYRDVRFWRQEFLRAIEETSVRKGDSRAACRVHVDGDTQVSLGRHHRADLLKGGFVVKSVDGVLVTLADTGAVEDKKTPKGFDWLRLNTLELSELLVRLMDADGHVDEATAAPTPPASAAVVEVATESVEPSADSPPKQRGGASQRALQRYRQVIDVLTEHRVGVVALEDEPAIEGPGFYVFRVGLERGQKPSAIYKLTEELKIGLALDAGHEPRSYADRGAVVIEIPKRSDERYYVDAQEMWDRTVWPEGKLYAPLGADVRDNVIGIEFSSSKSPHLLIGGITGGGKSVALETLLWGLAKHYSADDLKLWMVDPKGNEFVQFEGQPHVRQPIGMDAEDAIEMLEEGVEEMDRRYKLMKEASRARGSRVADIGAYNELVGAGDRFPWIVVVLDEFADLTAEKEARKTIEALLQRLAQKARACGIHCVVATQKPSAEVISTTTRSNLGAQLALRVRSGTDSRVIMETTGAESLAGNGDGFLRLSGEEPIRLQCARADLNPSSLGSNDKTGKQP